MSLAAVEEEAFWVRHDTVHIGWCCLAFNCRSMPFWGSLYLSWRKIQRRKAYVVLIKPHFCLEVEQTIDNDILNKIHLGNTFVDSHNHFVRKKGRISITETMSNELSLWQVSQSHLSSIFDIICIFSCKLTLYFRQRRADVMGFLMVSFHWLHLWQI